MLNAFNKVIEASQEYSIIPGAHFGTTEEIEKWAKRTRDS